MIDVQPHSQRIYLELWNNQAIEVLFYDEPQPNADDSDRIHLLVTRGNDKQGYLMNAEEAVAIIRGLSAGVARAIELGIPLKPKEK